MIYSRRRNGLLCVDPTRPVVREHPLNRGMVGWWLALPQVFGGRRYYDLGGKWHGTLGSGSASPAWQGTGRPNAYGGLAYSGASAQVVILPDFSGEFPNSEGTLSVWLKKNDETPATSQTAGLCSIGTGASNLSTAYPWTDGKMYLSVFDSGRPISGATAPTGKTNWHLFTIVSKAGTNGYRLFINGRLFAQATRGTWQISNAANRINLGGWNNLGQLFYLDGLADDWRLWNRPLSDADILALYQESLAGYPNALRRTPIYNGRASATTVSVSGFDFFSAFERAGLLSASTQSRDAAGFVDASGLTSSASQSRDSFSLADAPALVGSPAEGDAAGSGESVGVLGVSAAVGDPIGATEASGDLSALLADRDSLTLADLASALASTVSTDAFSVVDAAGVSAALGSSDGGALGDLGGYGVLITARDSFALADLATWDVAASSVDVVAMDSFALDDGRNRQETSSSTVYDDFTGAAGGSISGAKWTEHPNVSGGNSDIAIDSTGGRARGNRSGISIYYGNAAPPSADQALEWDFVDVAESATGTMIHGFGLRVPTNADSGYYGVLYRDTVGGTTEWRILKRSSGTQTTLGQATASFSVGTTYHFAFSAVGSLLTLSVDGAQQVQVADSSITATGRYAIYMDPIGTSPTTDGRLDDLAVPGSPQYRNLVAPESITLIVGESFGLAAAGPRLTTTLSTAEPFGLADSAGLAATLAQRDAWAFLDNGVFTFFGPVFVFSRDSFSFADRTGATAAEAADSEGFGISEGFGLAARLADFEAFAVAELWTIPFSLVTIAAVDSFGVLERGGGLAAGLVLSDGFAAGDAAAVGATLGAGDVFGLGQSGVFEVFTPPIGVYGSDSALFRESAAITVRVYGRDSTVLADRAAVAAAVASGDEMALAEAAFASLAPLMIVAMDAAGFAESLALSGSPSDQESWGWLASTAIGVGVASRDAFDAADSALYSRELAAADAFRWDDDQGLETFVGSLVYRIYANDGAGGPINYDSAVASTTDLSWTSWPLPAGSDQWFAVRVYSLAVTLEEENLDAAVRIVTDAAQADVTGRPNPPTGLRAVPLAGGMVRVEWTYRQAAAARRPTGFRVYQGAGSVDWGAAVATVPATGGIAGAYSTTLGPLTDGVAYRFGVRAYNAAAEEPNAVEAAATADATGPAPPSGLSAGLTTES